MWRLLGFFLLKCNKFILSVNVAVFFLRSMNIDNIFIVRGSVLKIIAPPLGYRMYSIFSL